MGTGLADFLSLSIVSFSVALSLLSGVLAWGAVAGGMVLYLLSDMGFKGCLFRALRLSPCLSGG